MKARLVLGSVRYFGFSAEEEKKISAFFKQKRIPAEKIAPSMTGCSVGSLFCLPGFDPKDSAEENSDFSEQVLLFSAIADLDSLLKELRRESLGTNALKAVLTPNNASWRFCDLVKELQREREEFRKK